VRSSRIIFLNPWDRLIGPNRYLVEMLRPEPEIASASLVVLPSEGSAADEYRQIGCKTAVWREVALVHPRVNVTNLFHLVRVHSFGVARLVERLRIERPRLVVSNAESVLTGCLASRWLGLTHWQVFHGMTFYHRLGSRPLLLKAYARLYRALNSRIMAVSQAVADVLERAGVPASMISVVPNPVPLDAEMCRGMEGESGLPVPWRGSPLLVTVGRISPMKGQDLLVEALPRIVKEFPDLRCVFAGRVGSDAGTENTFVFTRNLERRVLELGICENVCFAGEVEALIPLLQRADLYVQPSRMESFGRVVAEALGRGTPVVAFAVGGVPEVAGPGAVLVEPENSAALADAVIHALRSPGEMAERARRGREHVRKTYGAPEVAESFRRLLESLITEKAA
jgi:glycosyltransferase involved in cell wall biosynthesis